MPSPWWRPTHLHSSTPITRKEAPTSTTTHAQLEEHSHRCRLEACWRTLYHPPWCVPTPTDRSSGILVCRPAHPTEQKNYGPPNEPWLTRIELAARTTRLIEWCPALERGSNTNCLSYLVPCGTTPRFLQSPSISYASITSPKLEPSWRAKSHSSETGLWTTHLWWDPQRTARSMIDRWWLNQHWVLWRYRTTLGSLRWSLNHSAQPTVGSDQGSSRTTTQEN